MTVRVVLLVTSPRLPAGLLTAQAWDVVRSGRVLAGAESELTAAVRAAGAEVTVVGNPTAETLLAAAESGTAVWLAGPTGDEHLARELGLRLAREPGLAELELMYGSWDPPGARLLDAVAVMDRLASPGGDPWKREQTHDTLARFLLEECYEAYDAI
ncbi:MAG TPA: nucleoside triphosphate pyrophosphohydrolase, partial [Micromonosporaceae bacterium]|nr:nucleoside triphosphate pyrophosphohydrolase [Micromonosporaceae bacterium]